MGVQRLVAIVCICVVSGVVSLRAQDPIDTTTTSTPPPPPTNPAFVFSGMSRLSGQYADRQGSFQQVPENYARWEFSPTASFYGVPFTMNVLLSTEESIFRQNISSVSFDLDQNRLQGVLLDRAYEKLNELQSLKAAEEVMGAARLRDSLTALGEDRMRDLEMLKELSDLERMKERAVSESVEQLEKLGLISASEKFFMNFPSLSVGVTYPQYTMLTLSGAPVTGANVEWNPGMFYIAFAGGKSQREVELLNFTDSIYFQDTTRFRDTVIPTPSYNRTLYAGRIGYGRRDGSHLFFTGLFAQDDDSEFPLDSNSAAFTPQANYVFGIDARASFAEDRVALEGEIVGSVLTGDTRSADIKQNEDVPSFLTELVDPKISSSVDYSYSLKPIITIPETMTKLQGLFRMVGPGFRTLGNPSLRTDYQRLEAKLDQRFLERQIQVTATYRRDADNLVDWKRATTTITSFGAGLGLTFRKLPYLRINYTPYTQSYEDTSALIGKVNNKSTNVSVLAGYNFRLADISNTVTLAYNGQQSESDAIGQLYGVGTITGTYSTYFPSSLFLSFTGALSAVTQDTVTSNITSLDLSGGYTAFDIWTSQAGFSIVSQTNLDSRVGFFIGSSIALWDYGYFDIRAEKNVYDHTGRTFDNYDEFLLRATITTQW